MSEHASGRPLTLAEELRKSTGLNVACCYQCGKCSAGCPMAGEMPMPPHAMLRMAQLDQRARLLQDDSIWLCLTCETCTARCPNDVEPARLIDGLREIAARAYPTRAPRAIRAFHRAFLDEIRSHGRVFELGLVIRHKLLSGKLFQDATAAPGMLLKGKLKLVPHSIDGVEDVRRIFAACLAEEPPVEGGAEAGGAEAGGPAAH